MTTNIFFAHLLPEQHLYDDDDRKYSLKIGQRKKVPEIVKLDGDLITMVKNSSNICDDDKEKKEQQLFELSLQPPPPLP
ncbi:hypothetical protein DERP_000352 [Dermatophagoides pteronyssinus]|uniref:Uncharacterized protein n=1 Tax=Dermatophagoides pteronyssinus TaxID=6956 RepID=A0ABQ8IZX9_DERPT|nr:hypothetical protein DERP_000352 [Dermatophagoides pteronyssinus]